MHRWMEVVEDDKEEEEDGRRRQMLTLKRSRCEAGTHHALLQVSLCNWNPSHASFKVSQWNHNLFAHKHWLRRKAVLVAMSCAVPHDIWQKNEIFRQVPTNTEWNFKAMGTTQTAYRKHRMQISLYDTLHDFTVGIQLTQRQYICHQCWLSSQLHYMFKVKSYQQIH